MPQINFMNELGIAMVVLAVAMMTSIRILRDMRGQLYFGWAVCPVRGDPGWYYSYRSGLSGCSA